jgi:hypothetical protein
MKIIRMLRSIKFFHEGTQLKFDDMKVSVPEEDVIGKVYSQDKSKLYKITFTPTEKEIGNNVVVITSVDKSKKDSYHPFVYNKEGKLGDIYSRVKWVYGFTSYFATGSISVVPSLNASGLIVSKKKLSLIVGKNYIITLKQLEENKQ